MTLREILNGYDFGYEPELGTDLIRIIDWTGADRGGIEEYRFRNAEEILHFLSSVCGEDIHYCLSESLEFSESDIQNPFLEEKLQKIEKHPEEISCSSQPCSVLHPSTLRTTVTDRRFHDKGGDFMAEQKKSEKTLFRTENFLGTGFRDPVEVLTYEASEFGNTDAIEYIRDSFLQESSAEDVQEREKLCELRGEADECLKMIDSFELYSEEAIFRRIHEFFEAALSEIGSQKGKKLTYGLWLASEESVRDMYCYDDSEFEPFRSEFVIDEYDVSEGTIVDDLGFDGVFMVFDREMVPIRSYTFQKFQKGSRIPEEIQLLSKEEMHGTNVPDRCRDIIVNLCSDIEDMKQAVKCCEYDDLYSHLEWDIPEMEDRIFELKAIIDGLISERSLR